MIEVYDFGGESDYHETDLIKDFDTHGVGLDISYIQS